MKVAMFTIKPGNDEVEFDRSLRLHIELRLLERQAKREPRKMALEWIERLRRAG